MEAKNFDNIPTICKNLLSLGHSIKWYLIGYVLMMLVLIGISIIVPLLSAKLLLSVTKGLLSKVILVASVIFALEINRNTFNYFAGKLSQTFYINVLNDVQVHLAKET